ncbi:uroporphyrinogen-III synthase [Curtobacterium sp. MCSS17_008]|uniref:uroporphyrinogen-III synthase n=1 Tax=Curtobacterium sp. MCSS17_008 TaxID=2175647 RepID=UPI0021AC820F|nr:uroporphyrinogen-III synthase [Curtobacterium sp. MCSS17_008]
MVPLITDAPPEDPAALDAALARLVADAAAAAGAPAVVGAPAGRHDAPPADRTRPDGAGRGAPWLAVTSATAVRVVAGRVPRLPAGVRVACVGAATARAAHEAGWSVDLVPEDESAAGLAAALPADAGRVLFPRSEIAATTLVDGLRARGIVVSEVVAYRTVGTGDEPLVLAPPPDAVLVTSGSVAQQVVRRMTPLDPRTHVACIGPATADAARAAGLPVHVVARGRSAEALLDAVVETLHPNPRTGRSS